MRLNHLGMAHALRPVDFCMSHSCPPKEDIGRKALWPLWGVHLIDGMRRKAVNSGAMGYLIKQTSSDNLCAAIREVHKGNRFFSPSIPSRLHKQNRKKQMIELD
jgi:hypothetical protein